MQEERQPMGSESLGTLLRSWRDGTFSEIWDDWKWIWGYTKRYRRAVWFYTILGVASSTLGLVSAVASKYSIDIITGYDSDRLWFVVMVMVASALVGLLLDEATSALDVTTERTILRNLAARYPHKTCIVTTHRPTVISLCRRVYQVSGGRMELLDNDRAQRLAMDF